MDLSKPGEPDIQIAAIRIWVHWRQFEDAPGYWDGNWLRITAHCADSDGSARAHDSILQLSAWFAGPGKQNAKHRDSAGHRRRGVATRIGAAGLCQLGTTRVREHRVIPNRSFGR